MAKRKTLPRRYRPGVIAKLRRNTRLGQHMSGRYEQLCADQGGVGEMPATLASTTERYVFVEQQASTMELAAMEGRPFDLAAYLSTVQVLMKLGDRLGYVRRAKRVSLSDIKREYEGAQA